jgi:hypothetical protein
MAARRHAEAFGVDNDNDNGQEGNNNHNNPNRITRAATRRMQIILSRRNRRREGDARHNGSLGRVQDGGGGELAAANAAAPPRHHHPAARNNNNNINAPLLAEMAQIAQAERLDIMVRPEVVAAEARFYERRQTLDRQRLISFLNGGEAHLKLEGSCWSARQQARAARDMDRLLASLRVNQTVQLLQMGPDFLLGIVTFAQQKRVFDAICSMHKLVRLAIKGSPAVPQRIITSVLFQSLQASRNHLEELTIWNVNIPDAAHVEQLVRVLLQRGGSLERLSFKLAVPAAAPIGFLDPILRAMARPGSRQPPYFRFTGYDAASIHGPPLVTVEALRAYLVANVQFNGQASRSLTLEGLGLNDEHCQAIVEHFAMYNSNSNRMLHALWLRNNPDIGHEGYAVLLGLLNQHHATLQSVKVDDKSLQATFDFVVRMNTEFRRGQFLRDGVFSCREKWMEWMEYLREAAPAENERERARNVNFLFYSLLENPGFLSS